MASVSRRRLPPKEREALGILPLPTLIRMRRLLWFYELPEWFQLGNNEWVRDGYRPMSNSIRASFRSWFYLHNETVNIYSHLIPAVVFLLGEYHVLQCLAGQYPRVTSADLVAFSCFMLTATICFASSALYHTLMNHSYSESPSIVPTARPHRRSSATAPRRGSAAHGRRCPMSRGPPAARRSRSRVQTATPLGAWEWPLETAAIGT